MLTHHDRILLAKKGISEKEIKAQLKCFEEGFPFLKLKAAASVQHGIACFSVAEENSYIENWKKYTTGSHSIVKFVPASGAASRMFKDLFAFLDADRMEPKTSFELQFFEKIANFAFFSELNEVCLKNEKKSIEQLLQEKQYRVVVSNLLDEKGLNYGALPKGLLLFHSDGKTARTSLEEHLVEAARYAVNSEQTATLHFTVSAEHRALFEQKVKEVIDRYKKLFSIDFSISFSEQKPTTDTIAVDLENQPLHIEDTLLFRPGGHGALLENLNDIAADVVFIKNIDNVVPDRLKEETVRYKQVLAGLLVTLQKQCFQYLNLLDKGSYTENELQEMTLFLENQLFVRNAVFPTQDVTTRVAILRKKLNRPIRVCGMVKNVGEPGGGPFWVYAKDGSVSLHILESSQIDMSNETDKQMFTQGTHFNPVDLVCGLRDYKGAPFHLPDYVDRSTGFISYKSKNGKNLKALELPGLWNGAMSDWNTIFVEVPLATFNPVKTINDLLREQHQY